MSAVVVVLEEGGGGDGVGGGYSLTISALKCSTFYGLSTPLLMCEEITLFPTPVKITYSDVTGSTHCSKGFFFFFFVVNLIQKLQENAVELTRSNRCMHLITRENQ